jgi:hypothetical protein
MYQNYKLPGLSKLSRSKVVMDFQKIIVEARSCICVNHFLNVTIWIFMHVLQIVLVCFAKLVLDS